jgi:hypothetical protein
MYSIELEEREGERNGGRSFYETQYETATTTYTNVDRPHKNAVNHESTNSFSIINRSARAREGMSTDS